MKSVKIGAYTITMPEGAANMYVEKRGEGITVASISATKYLLEKAVSPMKRKDCSEKDILKVLDAYWSDSRSMQE